MVKKINLIFFRAFSLFSLLSILKFIVDLYLEIVGSSENNEWLHNGEKKVRETKWKNNNSEINIISYCQAFVSVLRAGNKNIFYGLEGNANRIWSRRNEFGMVWKPKKIDFK